MQTILSHSQSLSFRADKASGAMRQEADHLVTIETQMVGT